MNLLLLADGAVGAAILAALVQQWPDDIGLVVTTSENDISRQAAAHQIPHVVFSSEQDLADRVQALGLDSELGLLAWWPRIIRQTVLALPRYGFVNTHPSLLPYNRGKNYNFWALVEQNPFGVTLHRVDEGIDTGAIIAQREIPYAWNDTGGSLYRKAAAAMSELVIEAYPLLRSLDFPYIDQPKGAGSFRKAAEMAEASQIQLDEQYTARDLLNLLRARTFQDHPACWFRDGDEEFEVRVEITKRKN